MPTLPSPTLAGATERRFGKPGVVVEVERLSPGLRHVVLEVPALLGRPPMDGKDIEFRVDDRSFRHYTVYRHDPSTGRIEIVLATAADGPGTAWVMALGAGDPVLVLGPGGSIRGIRRMPRGPHLALGDTTAIALLSAHTRDRPSTGAIEVPGPDAAATAALAPHLEVLLAGRQPGQALDSWLSAAGRTGWDSAGRRTQRHDPTAAQPTGRRRSLPAADRHQGALGGWSPRPVTSALHRPASWDG
ncbi:MAG: siderophore-interacting protein [Phycicoccus sp.]